MRPSPSLTSVPPSFTSPLASPASLATFVSLVLAVLLLASCVSQQAESDFVRLQENAIDAEEENREMLRENLHLREDTEFYTDELVSLVEELKERPTQVVRELPFQRSPADRITDEQIGVGRNRVILDIEGAQRWFVRDTGSMRPVIDSGSTVLATLPSSPDSISEGDIIIYRSPETGESIIHRVITISLAPGSEEPSFITKGDNNPLPDPDPVGFSQVQAVVVAIIY